MYIYMYLLVTFHLYLLVTFHLPLIYLIRYLTFTSHLPHALPIVYLVHFCTGAQPQSSTANTCGIRGELWRAGHCLQRECHGFTVQRKGVRDDDARVRCAGVRKVGDGRMKGLTGRLHVLLYVLVQEVQMFMIRTNPALRTR